MGSIASLTVWATVRTRIGFPDHYWRHGAGAFLGFLLVLLLAEIAVVGMVDAVPWWSDDPRLRIPSGQRVPPSAWAVIYGIAKFLAPLLVAAVLLQFLPEARTGIQFLPCSPRAFSGWIPFTVSLLVWAGLGGCVLIVVTPVMDKVDGVAFFLLVTLLLNALLSFWSLTST
jgi:hypothetical protein